MNPSSIFEYEVYDRTGDKVGKVDNVWTDANEEIACLGISTGWLGLGHNHVIPARGVKIDYAEQTVRVPYDGDLIKSAPSYDSSTELSDIEARRLMSHYGPDSSGSRQESGCGCSTGSPVKSGDRTACSSTGQAEIEVPLAEEKLQVGKREASLGEVRLRKVVRTEVVNQPVELRHEEVIVERVSNKGAVPGSEAFVEKVVSIPVKEEQAVVQKTVQSAGTVKATKVSKTQDQNVSETLRKEDVEVERDLAVRR